MSDRPLSANESSEDNLDALMWTTNMMRGVAVTCMIVGVAVGIAVLDPEWSLAKRALGGAFLGAGTTMILLTNRVMRGEDD